MWVTEVCRDSVPCGPRTLPHQLRVLCNREQKHMSLCIVNFQHVSMNRTEGILVTVFVKAVLDVNESSSHWFCWKHNFALRKTWLFSLHLFSSWCQNFLAYQSQCAKWHNYEPVGTLWSFSWLVGFPFLISEVFCFVLIAKVTQCTRADLPVITSMGAWLAVSVLICSCSDVT